MTVERIEQLFTQLEPFWGIQVPAALAHEGWDEYEIIEFVEDNRAIPFDQYKSLVKAIGEDCEMDYAERLSRLDALIVQFTVALADLFDCDGSGLGFGINYD